MNWEHAIEAARMLAGSDGTATAPGRPRQARLRRAVSTAYYAMCNALCWSNADSLVGRVSAGSDAGIWMEVYRSLQHRNAKTRLSSYSQLRQDSAVQYFARVFGNLQEQRVNADYNPLARFTRSDVVLLIDRAEAATSAFYNAPIQTRRLLAAHLLARARN